MLGIAAGVTAIISYRNWHANTKTGSNNRVPVHEAAEQLRAAWADHRTTA
jgi:hypothetical protein